MTLVLVFNLILVVSCGFAFWKGGAPERWAALAYCLAALVTYIIPTRFWASFESMDAPLLAIDIAMLAMLVALTARANRYWPIWAAALQLVLVTVHLAKAYSPTILPVVYFAVSSRIAYIMLVLLVVGTVRHTQRVRRFGEDSSWTVKN